MDTMQTQTGLLQDSPLFELTAPGGQSWKLFANGKVEGFPEGTTVLNRALPLLHAAIAKEQLPRELVAN